MKSNNANKVFGVSTYLSTYDINYIKKFNKEIIVFLSLHIPEEIEIPDFKIKALKTINEIKENGYRIICDISPKGLEKLGFEKIELMVESLKIDFVRLDFGYEENVNELNKITKIIINASTINEIKSIPNESIFMHNFYLRKDTGISREYFNEINKKIKEKNGKIFTFIPGDNELRGPIYERLSTLEEHRKKETFITFLEMYNDENIDGIFIADISLNEETINNINSYIKNRTINIKTNATSKLLIGKELTIRSDSGANVYRINESRWTNKTEEIKPKNNFKRDAGTITIDNVGYKRYMGEIQITKIDLPADDRVNILGNINKDYISVIKPLSKIKFYN